MEGEKHRGYVLKRYGKPEPCDFQHPGSGVEAGLVFQGLGALRSCAVRIPNTDQHNRSYHSEGIKL